jgi:hypothetical protein
MEESKRGLVGWEESAYILRGEDLDSAFQQALEEGRRHESWSKPGRYRIAVRLAGILVLDRLGPDPRDLLIPAGSQKPAEHLPFDHVFEPEAGFPPPSF